MNKEQIEIETYHLICHRLVDEKTHESNRLAMIRTHVRDAQKKIDELVPAKSVCTFRREAVIRHVKTSGVYQIIGTPAEGWRIEATNRPAYAYRSQDQKSVWVRDASEMEDGRFVLIS